MGHITSTDFARISCLDFGRCTIRPAFQIHPIGVSNEWTMFMNTWIKFVEYHIHFNVLHFKLLPHSTFFFPSWAQSKPFHNQIWNGMRIANKCCYRWFNGVVFQYHIIELNARHSFRLIIRLNLLQYLTFRRGASFSTLKFGANQSHLNELINWMMNVMQPNIQNWLKFFFRINFPVKD